MKRIAFLTATRADYGKMKPIIRAVHESDNFESHVFVTGMHNLDKFGYTAGEVSKDGYGNVVCDEDYRFDLRMDVTLANVVGSFSRFIRIIKPHMVVVHGDRLDAIAGALVGVFNHTLVGHIEGGEISGTIDESIRHAVSKFAHIHFTANEETRKRLIQMGEPNDRIYVIGSPDVDIMLSNSLPPLSAVIERYDMAYEKYGILIFHPVVTELESTKKHIGEVMKALVESGRNFVIIYPNNDPGHEDILQAYNGLPERFCAFPSMRFEYFLTLLKNAEFIIGNSSSGVREACVYGIPAIDIGSRQAGRYNSDNLCNVIHSEPEKQSLLDAIKRISEHRIKSLYFGKGDSAGRFMEIINHDDLWKVSQQKRFVDFMGDSL